VLRTILALGENLCGVTILVGAIGIIFKNNESTCKFKYAKTFYYKSISWRNMKKIFILFFIIVTNSWAIDPATAKLYLETIVKVKIKSLNNTEVDVAFYDTNTKADGDGNLLKRALFTTPERSNSKIPTDLYPMSTYFGSIPDVDPDIKTIMVKNKEDIAFYKLNSGRGWSEGENDKYKYEIYQGFFCTWDKTTNRWATEIYIIIYGTWYGGDYIINNFGGGGWPNYDENGNMVDDF
jgi:hypothetical protein